MGWDVETCLQQSAEAIVMAETHAKNPGGDLTSKRWLEISQRWEQLAAQYRLSKYYYKREDQ